MVCLSLLVAAGFSCLLFVQSAHPSIHVLATKDEVLPQWLKTNFWLGACRQFKNSIIILPNNLKNTVWCMYLDTNVMSHADYWILIIFSVSFSWWLNFFQLICWYFKCMTVFFMIEAQWPHGWCTYLDIEWTKFVSWPGTLHCVLYSHNTSLQVYKWVAANLMLRITPRWTSIASREE